MHLRFVEFGTRLDFKHADSTAPSDAPYSATFHDLASETSFYACGEELYDAYAGFGADNRLYVTFARFAHIYSFYARATGRLIEGGKRLTLIEQLTGMDTISRRKDYRDEITLDMALYGITEEDFLAGRIVKAEPAPVFTCETFDISNGGTCLVSNWPLESKYRPYFICEFTIGEDEFSLPAKLRRAGNSPQTSRYHYDYGFEFVYDGIEKEQARLTNSLFSFKLRR